MSAIVAIGATLVGITVLLASAQHVDEASPATHVQRIHRRTAGHHRGHGHPARKRY
ncbi:MAG TPA: hypothetical protein VHW67_09985 [Solirubrobacteraceae bacterium]|nr:hypothetical protein [Solirubrobacteraceae bacterium]